MEIEEYQKYRWFFTKSGKLVIGGKSAEQNDSLLKDIKSKSKDYLVMHTSSPGSPFSIILSEIRHVSESDIKESAVFTACFSRAWRSQNKKEKVDIFKLSSLYKLASMNQGSWGVKNKIKSLIASLELVLAVQKGVLRAIPESSLKARKSILLRIFPGKTDKQKMMQKIASLLPQKFSQEEILQALPPGGVAIKNGN